MAHNSTCIRFTRFGFNILDILRTFLWILYLLWQLGVSSQLLTAVKLFNIGNLTLFFFNLLSAYGNMESYYFPRFNMRKVITSRVLKCGK